MIAAKAVDRAQEISQKLFENGAKADEGTFKGKATVAVVINERLLELIDLPKNPEIISDAFCGIGMLAEAKKIDGQLNVDSINALLGQLLNSFEKSHNNTQQLMKILQVKTASKVSIAEIAETITDHLFWLAMIADAGNIYGELDGSIINDLLVLLMNSNPTTKNIAQSIYALGKIIKAENIASEQIQASTIHHLLNLFIDLNPDAQAIAQGSFGLKLIMQSGKVIKQIDEVMMNKILNFTIQQNPQTQEVVSVINRLAFFLENHERHNGFSALYLNQLLALLNVKYMRKKDIFDVITFLGEISKNQKIEGKLNAALLEPLLMQYMHFESKLTVKNIFNTINRIMTIAENGHMEGQLSAVLMFGVLQKLVDLGKGVMRYDMIARIIFGLANMADKNIVSEKIDVALFNYILEELSVKGTNLAAEKIVRIIMGFGINTNIQGKLDGFLLDKLLNQLNSSDPLPTVSQMSSCLSNLKLMCENDNIDQAFLTSFFKSRVFFDFIKTLENENKVAFTLNINALRYFGLNRQVKLQEVSIEQPTVVREELKIINPAKIRSYNRKLCMR